MPLVRIEVAKGRSPEDKRRLLDAVHAALVEAFRIPDDDRYQRLIEHEGEDFDVPAKHGGRFVLVEVTAFPGRSREAKKALYAALIRELEAIGVPPGDAQIVLIEPRLEDWGISGGQPADEVDLGFRLDV